MNVFDTEFKRKWIAATVCLCSGYFTAFFVESQHGEIGHVLRLGYAVLITVLGIVLMLDAIRSYEFETQ